MAVRFRAWLLMSCVFVAGSLAATEQARSRIVAAIDIRATTPSTVTIAGQRHLVYELHLTNYATSEIALSRVEVLEAARSRVLGRFSEAALSNRLGRPGAPRNLPDKRVVAPGMQAVLFLWLPLEGGERVPTRVQHTIELDVIRPDHRQPVVVNSEAIDVRQDQPLVLNPPLRGGPWGALYDPQLVGGHRTSLYAVDGRVRIPARFAIDWVRLENDGTYARGDRSQIANWHGYGADVLAVADGTIVEARDDIAEAPSVAGGQQAMPLENASGNYIVLDLGGQKFAFYEHLKHGSVRVRPGQRVKSGDVLASLGNSGSSSFGPHLHFHVADARAELAGEGAPFAFRAFEVVGAFETLNSVVVGDSWKPVPARAGGIRRSELPAPLAVVMFSGRQPPR